MASAGCRARPKMAADGAGQRGRSEPRGGPGRRVQGALESGCTKTNAAQPAGEAAPPACSRRPSSCSSRKVSDRRPAKRLKCEKNSLVNSELEGLACGSGNLAALGETPQTPDGDQCSEDPGEHNVIQQGKGESVREVKGGNQEREGAVSVEPQAVKCSSAASGTDGDGDVRGAAGSEEEDGGCSARSDGSGSDAGDPGEPAQPDNSAFLDEDSNQPMPVHRFFGDGEFLKDLPAAALPRTRMSRREFRKLHFIAKEDEEEEEEDVV
ncbi:UPF0688 protein C1orf174 homolog isoform X2 [Patagioenas fasciata]|uniref:UPF0688 protein C1orf174 homolog isoform X2 n=1 Tax=Patagioenas fasciata TaxID=372321 RepID=UPI0032E857FD